MASGLFSSIQSLSTKLLDAIRGTTSTSHQQDPSSPVTDQHKSVRKDLEKLSRMLARIQAVQQDAEEREIHDCYVRFWLAELRGVAYKADDVLDEFYYEVLRSIVDSGDAAIEAYHRDRGTKRKFTEMDTSSSIASYSFSIPKVVIPDGMAEKIKGITERFEEISNARRDLHLREDDGTRLVNGPQIRPPTSSHVDERAIFGREKEKENIISLLNPINDPEFMVLLIIGMGGLGKTTLAQLVYNDTKFLQLFDKRAWVSVSEDFDLVRLTRAIIESINRTTCEFSELSILQDILKEKISHVSLFLVLDDVWNENTELWEHFQVALKGGTTVKILTTTRNTSVAEIMQTTSPIHLDCLPDENCWSLLKHFAFNNAITSENKNLLEIGYGIVQKCKGSPLVTKVLGGILRYDMDEEKWREVLESDISKIDESGKIYTPLQLSYQKLTLHLKPCFVYFAMFPKGELINRDHVVRLWMAQGYINTNSSRTNKTLEEIGSEYLNELQGRSLIDCGDYNTCYVHDLIHDLARSISQRTNQPVSENDNLWNSSYKINHLYLTNKHELSDVLASCNNKVIRTYVTGCQRNYIDDSAIFSKITNVRALELRNCILPDTLSTMKHLRYLSIGDDKTESLPESLCLLYHLQTLDMICHNILELPENIKTLINLRFLRLCSGKIKQLPESISLLHNLHTLSIEHCSKLEKLPTSIEKLTNLRVLKLSEFLICDLSSGIGKLTNLITLSGNFKFMESDMTQGLGELRDMNRLSGLMSISGLKNVGNIEYSRKANLVSESNLSKLILNFEEDDGAHKSFLKYGNQDPVLDIAVSSSTSGKNENNGKIQEGVLESLQPHGNLTVLVILNYRGRKVPPWLRDPSLMSKLTTLTLHFHMEPSIGACKDCGFREILFSSPSELKRLSILNCRELVSINYKIGDLPFLESISLFRCPNLSMLSAIPQELKQLDIGDVGFREINLSSLSKLQNISIFNCRQLVSIYYKIGDLPFLESISLSGCPNLLMLPAIPLELKKLYIEDVGFQEINLSSLSKLQKISIFYCRDLASIYYKIGDLPSLESILLSSCLNLTMLSAIPQELKQMHIEYVGLQEINFPSLSKLQKITIFNCRELVSIYYKIGDLPFLESISLSGCPHLLMLPAIPQELKKLHIADVGFQEINLSSLTKIQKISIFDCRELVSIYYKMGDLSFLESISLAECPKLLIFSGILDEMKQMDKRNSDFQSEIENVYDYREFIPPSLGRVSLFNCPKLRIFSAIPAVELDTMKIIHCSIHETILPSRCHLLEIRNCPELISVHWRDGDSSSLPLVKFVDCPQLKLLKVPKEVEVLKIRSCGTHEIIFSSQSKVRSVDINGCPELISLQFLQGDIPLLEKFAIKSCPQFHEVLTIPYQLKELKIVDCHFPEIHLLPQSKLQQLIISECANLTGIKGLQVQFPTGDVSHPMMEKVDIRNCPRMDFGTQGNSYFYQGTQEASQDLGTKEP